MCRVYLLYAINYYTLIFALMNKTGGAHMEFGSDIFNQRLIR